MQASVAVSQENVRLDKWLWAARFFKTRALAAGAVSAGKVHSAGQSVKPSRGVKVGDSFDIRRGYECFGIVVTQLSERRGSATAAQLLYRETASSVDKRKGEAEKRRLAMMARPQSEGRPDKKQRRQIRRFIEKP